MHHAVRCLLPLQGLLSPYAMLVALLPSSPFLASHLDATFIWTQFAKLIVLCRLNPKSGIVVLHVFVAPNDSDEVADRIPAIFASSTRVITPLVDWRSQAANRQGRNV